MIDRLFQGELIDLDRRYVNVLAVTRRYLAEQTSRKPGSTGEMHYGKLAGYMMDLRKLQSRFARENRLGVCIAC